MPSFESHFAALDEALWEFSLVFEGLADEDLWKRPHPNLLSVGELAGHVAYGEAQYLANHPESPLVSQVFSYYPHQLASPVALDLGVEAVAAEMKRVHEAFKAGVLELNATLQDHTPGREGWTWQQALQYQTFHIAYHTGQAYSVRHLFGHETTDN